METQRRQAAEVRVLEEELRMARADWPTDCYTADFREPVTTTNVPAAPWLQGPVTCIEHAAVRQPHAEKMRQLQDLRDQLQEAEHRLAVDTVNSRPWSSPGPAAQINSFAEVLAPSEVVVSRHRRFSGRLFRLWVEDLAQRRGVRVHALDTSSFLRSCVDLSDVDIQAMFDHWFLRLSRSRQKSLQAPLKQFLLLLLDAAYFDMPDGSELRLRVPSVIPALPPDPEQELIEVAKAPELTKEWIRDQILVPKAMGVSASRPSSGKLKPSKASRSSGYGCYARSASRGHSQGPPRPARPSSARMAVLASPRRSSSISQSLGSGSMSECLPTTASYAESERSVRARSRGMRLRWPMEEREEAWGNLAPPSYSHSYSQVMTESRRLRPSSAKVHKHKRVTPAEAWENEEDIYDDLEPSVAGDLEHCSEFLGQDLSEAFGRQSEPPMRGGWIQEGMM